jgi:hypothetical protein
MPTGRRVVKITPTGCGDTSPDDAPPGSMTALTNLVPDPANKDIWVPRPAASVFASTQAQFSPGFISALFVTSRYAYGMVSSALNAGKDQPFAYDLIAGAFIAISGITGANTPTSPNTTGAWQPPTMDQVGQYILVTHPGFTGGNGFFGWIDVTNPAGPIWASGNLATNPLPSPATFVKQFNQRAFYAVAPPGVAPATYASNVLAPLTASNALILTYGDSRPIYALGTIGLKNVFGGRTQALLIFKDNNVFHLTGDWAAGGAIGTIALNSLNVAVGTVSPLSVVSTPRGVAFLSQDGFRNIDWEGHISDPIGLAGSGIVVPFTQSLVPSRVVVACNGQTIRATTQNNSAIGQPFQEWVFDIERKVWHGPHTFPASQIARYGVSYVVAPVGLTGLWQSDILPGVSSQYVENGVQLTWTWKTALIANEDSMYEQGCIDATIYCGGLLTGQQFTLSAENASGNTLSAVPVTPPVSGAGSLWGTMVWGRDKWGSSFSKEMSNVNVPWDMPLVFDRVRFTLQGVSSLGVAVGEMRAVFEELEYEAILG